MSPSRVEASPIDFHGLRLRVEWRDLGYDRGIAIRVFVVAATHPWFEAVKIDAFQRRPHLHVRTKDGAERVEKLDGVGGIGRCLDLLFELGVLLDQAGFQQQSAELIDEEVRSVLLPAVTRAIQSVSPTEEQ